MCFFFFKQKTAYEMRISDWSSDVCSSDLTVESVEGVISKLEPFLPDGLKIVYPYDTTPVVEASIESVVHTLFERSEEHTSELQSLMRISYAVFCLKKKKTNTYILQSNS